MIVSHKNDEVFQRFLNFVDSVDLSRLTERQLEVLELVSKGFTNEGIAKQLFISKETVKSHMKVLYRLLDSIKADNEPSTLRLKLAFIWLIKNNQIPQVLLEKNLNF